MRRMTCKLSERNKNTSSSKQKNGEDDAFEKTINLWYSFQEENEDDQNLFTKEQIIEFLKKELHIYLNFLTDIETKLKVQGYLPLLQKLNYNDEKSVANFLFVLEIMISNLKRTLKMRSKKNFK